MGSEDHDRERMSDDLTIAYQLGLHDMLEKLRERADEIERLRAENERLREALKPFAYNYQNNGLSYSTFMFAMKDLLAAKKALGDTDE